MRNILFTQLLLLVYELSFGQISAILIDSKTNEKIPYVNIWVENENIGTTSNENGEFNLNFSGNNKTIIFSSIGYETLRINSGLIKNFVKLQQKPIELKEIVVGKIKKRQEKVIERFGKKELNMYFSCSTTPWMVAKFFQFKEEYNQTPYLKKMKIFTKSEVKNAKFNIRFYSVNEKGMPGEFIYDKNIIGIAPKGKRMTEVDLSKLGIIFPKKNFFVVLEWLIIDSNKYEFIYTTIGSKKKKKDIRYCPEFVTTPSDTEAMWIYRKGMWIKGEKNVSIPLKNYQGKYNPLAIELTLSN